jgi:hypothetical protein
MTTWILLTPYPGDLEYDLKLNSNYPSQNDKVLMSTTSPANYLGKFWIAQKQSLPIGLKWVQQ